MSKAISGTFGLFGRGVGMSKAISGTFGLFGLGVGMSKAINGTFGLLGRGVGMSKVNSGTFGLFGLGVGMSKAAAFKDVSFVTGILFELPKIAQVRKREAVKIRFIGRFISLILGTTTLDRTVT